MILDKTENINNDNTYELAVGKHVHVIQTVFWKKLNKFVL